jgi:polyhydroxyalkanoate synthase
MEFPMSNSSEIFDMGVAQLRNTIDPFGISTSILQAQQAWLQHPVELARQLHQLGSDLWKLQAYACHRLAGPECGDVFVPVEYDERFQETVWTENRFLDVVKQYYLLYTRWLEDAIFETPEMTEKDRRRAAFWVRQGLNALAPNNYFWTNPHAVQRFMESAGTSLLDGARNWARDSQRGDVSMVDESAFEVGKNLATTEGQVVLRNELLELIQYSPSTEQVHAIPLLIVAPWINKYYILDLKPAKSLVRYLVDRGYTVFMTSWKNPTTEMRGTTMDDYMLKGLVPAVEAARSICDVPQIHATGYCIGGTMLAALMAWYARATEHSGQPSPIAHWTLFTTLVDFANPGDIDVFIDEEGIESIERMMEARGYLDGRELAMSFRMLRSNSLIWNYFVHNYLYGEEPPQFDVLYWNTDSTRLPQAMHAFYLRDFYLENKLVQPDAIELGGQPIDLGRITQPLYAVGTEQDHIAPWKETFKICRYVSGECRYVLATSGHIMGVISPPVDPPKRRYWVGDATGAQDPEEWRGAQPKLPGSWWEDWNVWLDQRCGPLQAASGLGNETYPPLVAAPGNYVLER